MFKRNEFLSTFASTRSSSRQKSNGRVRKILRMLEHSTLLLHEWTRSSMPEGRTWVRSIADASGRRLGFVRHQRLAAMSWLFWLRKIRLDVFETDDASHLMTLTRSWTLFPIWELHDAEDRHVGSVYPKSL